MSALYFREGSLFDSVEAAIVPNPGVLIEDGRIVAVGGPMPAGVEPIDLSGKALLPGLVNAHTHLSMFGFGEDYYGVYRQPPQLQLLRAVRAGLVMLGQGVTTVRDLGGIEAVAIWLRRAIEMGLLRGPRIVTAGNPISPSHTGEVVHEPGMTVEAFDADQIRARAERLAEQGADLIKIKTDRRDFGPEGKSRYFTIEEMRAGFAVAEAAGLRKTAHANEPFIIRDAIAAGAEAIEHGQFLAREPALIDLLRERDVFLTPCANSWSLSAAGTDERRDCQRLAIRLGLEAGVPLAVGTDLYTERMVDEMAWFVEGGASPLRALQAATLTGARLCGLAGKVGVIAPGHRADLVVVDGDPASGLSVLANPALVVVDGVALTPREILGAVGPISRIRTEAQ